MIHALDNPQFLLYDAGMSDGCSKSEPETDAEFLERLQRIAEDWRFSDGFIGTVVRNRYPRNYDDAREASRVR